MSNKNVYRDMGKSIFSDECYTTFAESEKIVEYLFNNEIINKETKIWLPFDNLLSNIYKALKKHTDNLIISNLEMGIDFYLYKPVNFDIIISNPPFKGRTNLFKRLHEIDKPFIILQATQMFNNQYTINYLCDFSNDYKFILPRSRMNFLTFNPQENVIKSSKNGAAFYSFWLCYKVNLEKTFNHLFDNGREKQIEIYDKQGNVIIDNHLNLFSIE